MVRDLFCDESKALVIGAVTLIRLSQQGVERFPGPDSCGAVSRHSEGGHVSHLIKKSGMVIGLVRGDPYSTYDRRGGGGWSKLV